MSSIENIISTVSCISSDESYLPDVNNIICLDTSNNRIGINTTSPAAPQKLKFCQIWTKNLQ